MKILQKADVTDASMLAPRQNAQPVTSFFLSDSSPMMHYSAPMAPAWTTGYALQQDGWDSSVHLSGQNDSTISFNITATSLTLLIPYFANCASTLTLNSSAPVPACATPTRSFNLQDLPLGSHHVAYNTNTLSPGQEVSFWGVDATRPYDGTQWSNVTIDSAQAGKGDASLRYDGDWTMETGSSGAGYRTLSVTSKGGSSVEFSSKGKSSSRPAGDEADGTGSAIYLYGTTGPGFSSASIMLNDALVETSLNFSATWTSTYQLLWFRTGLDPSGDSKVVMTNLEDKRMTLDFVLLTADATEIAKLNDTSQPFLSTLPGKIVVFGLVPLLVLVLIGALTYFLFIRPRSARSAAPSSWASPRTMRHQDSKQKLRPSHLDFGRNVTPPDSGMTDKASPPSQYDRRYNHRPPPSARSVGTNGTGGAELVVTYEEGRKRLSDRMASLRSPFSDMSKGGYGSETPLGLPSPVHSPLRFDPSQFPSGLASPAVDKPKSTLLRPFQFLLGRSPRTQTTPAVVPNTHEADISFSATSPLPSAFGTPTSASATEAQLVQWSLAKQHRGHLQPLFTLHPGTDLGPPLFSSSLPVSDRDLTRNQPHSARFRPSDGPSAGRTSISFSDVMSVMAAPPSVRDMESGDFLSVHTGRSGPSSALFSPDDAPSLPTYSASLEPSSGPYASHNTAPLHIKARPVPSAYSLPHRSSTSDSYRNSAPALSASTPLTPPRTTSRGGLAPSPARPESTTNGSFLASPTVEATRMQHPYSYNAQNRARAMSSTSRSSAFTALSAARPDSEVIPFEEFVAGLKEGQRRMKEERTGGRETDLGDDRHEEGATLDTGRGVDWGQA